MTDALETSKMIEEKIQIQAGVQYYNIGPTLGESESDSDEISEEEEEYFSNSAISDEFDMSSANVTKSLFQNQDCQSPVIKNVHTNLSEFLISDELKKQLDELKDINLNNTKAPAYSDWYGKQLLLDSPLHSSPNFSKNNLLGVCRNHSYIRHIGHKSHKKHFEDIDVTRNAFPSTLTSLDISPSNENYSIFASGNQIFFYDLDMNKMFHQQVVSQDNVTKCTFSINDSNHAIVCDKSVQFW
eukprot:CAMPEP_0117419112 /NCGR_PEP_ID=MMETSP0758-20121206/753_1 /TAXON_ID=63605 /ORGANISM="Percolomonas cosmopolitus, Strain AE-1 (ATCC 50343)" /LENGTH=241 /DNA_ID=CAMNT_0005200009 /DNA_START=2025 /DNA_END=2747 /DNA_ORIENTATION=+